MKTLTAISCNKDKFSKKYDVKNKSKKVEVTSFYFKFAP